jgi:hypothetical protein
MKFPRHRMDSGIRQIDDLANKALYDKGAQYIELSKVLTSIPFTDHVFVVQNEPVQKIIGIVKVTNQNTANGHLAIMQENSKKQIQDSDFIAFRPDTIDIITNYYGIRMPKLETFDANNFQARDTYAISKKVISALFGDDDKNDSEFPHSLKKTS